MDLPRLRRPRDYGRGCYRPRQTKREWSGDAPAALAAAVRIVAEDFELDDDWLNTVVAKQWPSSGLSCGSGNRRSAVSERKTKGTRSRTVGPSTQSIIRFDTLYGRGI